MSSVSLKEDFDSLEFGLDESGNRTVSQTFRVFGLSVNEMDQALEYGPAAGAQFETKNAWLKSKRVRRTGAPGMLLLVCEYGAKSTQNLATTSNINKVIWTTKIGTSTAHVNACEKGKQRTVPEFDAALVGDQIGLKDSPEGPIAEGVDARVPCASLTCQTWKRPADVTDAWKRSIYNYVPMVNKSAFKGWAAGEVQFLGIDVVESTGEVTAVTFNFECSGNIIKTFEYIDSQGVKKIGAITKKGFEALSIRQGVRKFPASSSDPDGEIKSQNGILSISVAELYQEIEFTQFGLEALKGVFGTNDASSIRHFGSA